MPTKHKTHFHPFARIKQSYNNSSKLVRVFAVVVAILFVYGAIYGTYIGIDRYKFTRMENALHALADDMVAEFGGEVTSAEGSCQRSQEKSGPGQLSCRYSIQTTAQAPSKEAALEVLRKKMSMEVTLDSVLKNSSLMASQ